MATGATDKDFKLVVPDREECASGDDVTLPCHLSPETSAVAMEIRWFRRSDCIYLYKNGDVIEGRGYKGRVSVNYEELQRGDVSLTLSKVSSEDGGVYTCQVISGGRKEDASVELSFEISLDLKVLMATQHMQREITAEEMKAMKESIQSMAPPSWWQATDELMEKQRQLEENKNRMKEKEKQLKEKDMEIEERNQEMEKMKLQLEEKNREMEKTKQQLEENTEDMEKMNRQLDEKNKLLQDRDTEWENITKRERERENLLGSMTSELETRKIQVQDLRTQLQEQERELVEREICGDDPDHPPRRRGSMDGPIGLGGESPGPAAPVSPAVSELRLVLLGGSAAGKRAAGNTILSTQTPTHTSTEIQHSESRQGEVAGRQVTVVDTPDWFCSGLSEKDMRQEVGLCVRLSAPGPHTFLLVIPVEPFEGEERRMLENMEDIFGEDCWRHTLIIFTHAKGLRKRNVEELLQTGSQELQQLVEKCGNRCHLLNINNRPDDTEITQLLEKIDEMVSGNREKFYSSETYQEAERQSRVMKRRMEEKSMACKERKEKEMQSKHEKELENLLTKMKVEIQEKEDIILALERIITELERKLENEKNEEKRRELERQLKEEQEKRGEIEMEKERLKEDLEKEKKEMEERHKEEMEKIRESSEKEARAEAEIDLMKIILPELQRNMIIFKKRIEEDFSRQMEEKNREMEEKTKQQLEEKNREMDEIKQQLEKKINLLQEKDTEQENMTKRERERESLLENMTSELEASKGQVQDLRTQLQEQERELVERDKKLEVERQIYGDDPDHPPIRRRGSMDGPIGMGGESPGPAAPERKEKEMQATHEEELENSLKKMKGEIQEKEEKILALERRTAELEKEEREMEEKNREMEVKKREMEDKKREMEDEKRQMEDKKRDMEDEKREMEEKNREMEEKKREIEKDRKMEEKNREMEEKNREIEEKKREIEEKNREFEVKDNEMGGLVETVQKLSHLVEKMDEMIIQTDGEGQGD